MAKAELWIGCIPLAEIEAISELERRGYTVKVKKMRTVVTEESLYSITKGSITMDWSTYALGQIFENLPDTVDRQFALEASIRAKSALIKAHEAINAL